MNTLRTLLLLIAVLLVTDSVRAQRNLTDIPRPDPAAELRAMEVTADFEINLFAADPMVANPIQMNFDSEGRLWVASSPIYPHILPGQEATDKIFVLEDDDGDGVADRSTVFAENLLIPTGVLPGDGGAYVANSTELLHLSDTDGDGRADRRRVVLSGFGAEDTHHIIHCFRWGPEGSFYFNQSIYIHSHVETPHGVRRLRAGGIWRFRPRTLDLEVFVHGMVNGWGHHFDRWGQSFGTDGAYFEGINYFMPGAKFATALGARRVFPGLNRGTPKYCGAVIVTGRHLPESWQGDLVTCDFRAQRVVRYSLAEDGAGYSAREEPTVIKSSHVSFRPVDVKMGPDGAIYICDWYNPIIQHGEVDFRDPRRNHVNGRIWRLKARGRAGVERPSIEKSSVPGLLELLEVPEFYTRERARRRLQEMPAAEVVPHLESWLEGLDPEQEDHEQLLLEGLWVASGLDHHDLALLDRLLKARRGPARAAGVRILSHWLDHVEDPFPRLERAIADPFPRVRLEAVRALARIEEPRAADLALRILDHPVDRFLEYSLWRTVQDLEDQWLPRLNRGELPFGGEVRKLEYALTARGSGAVVPALRKLVSTATLDATRMVKLLGLISRHGSADDLRFVIERLDGAPPAVLEPVVNDLVNASREKKIALPGQSSRVASLIESSRPALRRAGLRLVGLWKIEDLVDRLAKAEKDEDPAVVRAALESLAHLGPERVRHLEELATSAEKTELRLLATEALATRDVKRAAPPAAALLGGSLEAASTESLIRAFVTRQEGAAALASQLESDSLPEEVARVGLRALDELAIQESPLHPIFREALGSMKKWGELEPAEVQKLTADVIRLGNPTRGQEIYHREELACNSCHAIGGAGGLVGPDFSSLGASAPLDYLVESVLFPARKVKENYHSVQVITRRGQILTGIPIRDGDDELVIRDADGLEQTISTTTILKRTTGGSIMPDGLLDGLERQELLDLISFLSRLGKVDRFSVGRTPLLRSWRIRQWSPGQPPPPEAPWKPAYSRVDGSLPLDPGAGTRVLARSQLEVTTAGRLKLRLNGQQGIRILGPGEGSRPVTGDVELELETGVHTVELEIDLEKHEPVLRCELVPVPGSPATFQPVGGR